MLNKIKNRLGGAQGFTLIELLVVIVILGILAAIAVPSYLSFRGKAQSTANEANVRSAIPAAESFYQTASTYTGLSSTQLQAQAPGVSPTVLAVALNSGAGYCIQAGDTAVPAAADAYHYLGGAPGAGVGTNALATIATGTCSSVDGGVTPG